MNFSDDELDKLKKHHFKLIKINKNKSCVYICLLKKIVENELKILIKIGHSYDIYNRISGLTTDFGQIFYLNIYPCYKYYEFEQHLFSVFYQFNFKITKNNGKISNEIFLVTIEQYKTIISYIEENIKLFVPIDAINNYDNTQIINLINGISEEEIIVEEVVEDVVNKKSNYECLFCNYKTNKCSTMRHHIEKKKNCDPRIKEIFNQHIILRICFYCNKKYKNKEDHDKNCSFLLKKMISEKNDLIELQKNIILLNENLNKQIKENISLKKIINNQ